MRVEKSGERSKAPFSPRMVFGGCSGRQHIVRQSGISNQAWLVLDVTRLDPGKLGAEAPGLYVSHCESIIGVYSISQEAVQEQCQSGTKHFLVTAINSWYKSHVSTASGCAKS